LKEIDRREFVKGAVAGVAAVTGLGRAAAFAGQTPDRSPNIVYVFADQMRAQAMACMGNSQVLTPNLDHLASQGLLVTNAIACQPVCSPARAQLLTGRYGHVTGVIRNELRLRDDEVTIAEVFKAHGYTTGYIGKWHLAGTRRDPVDEENRRGWDFWAVRNCSHRYFRPAYWLNDATKPVRVEGWEPDVQTDLAIDYIQRNKERPFCLMVSFGPPHNPYKAPKRYTKMYEGRQLRSRPNVPGGEDAAALLPYHAMVTGLDECVGRIAEALTEAGIADDTILCFSSDHGDMLGSHGQHMKQRPWEECINVPFILRYPRAVTAGQRRDWIVASVDVMPTLLGLCGISAPKGVQGLDLSATFCGQSQRLREAAFLFNVNGGTGPGSDWRGIRTHEWIYAYHAQGDWVMYDLKNDPYELHNLVSQPEYGERKAELRQRLESMREELGEDLPLRGRLREPAIKS